MREPIRILHEVGRMEPGGIQQFIMNVYHHIDRNQVQFDFMVYKGHAWFEKEIKQLGGHIYPLDSNMGRFRLLNNIKKELNKAKILKEHSFHMIHIHCGKPRPCHIAFIPKFCGVRERIYHGHNSQRELPSLWQVLMVKLARQGIALSCNHFFACSDPAAEWNLSRKNVQRKNYTLLKDGIDTQRFSFDEEKRRKTRKELGIQDAFVVGHVGRFAAAKNHTFVIEIFCDLKKKRKDAVLLLIGEGELMPDIKQKAAELGLEDSVIFYGISKEIENLYMAMDAFLLPSLFEGFGMVALEAQTAGLPTFVSDTLPDSIHITDQIKFLPLDTTKPWVEELQGAAPADRTGLAQKVAEAGYDINTTASILQDFYLNFRRKDKEK